MERRGDALIMVAVLTYRRPADLEELLPELIDHVDGFGGRVEIVVIDNDPDGSARQQVEAFGLNAPVRYVHEATPGIAAARNRALAEGVSHDLLVFIDDDERPTDGWLGNLFDTYAVDHPAAVVGPVVSRYESEPGPWIRAGGFFERRRFPTGTVVTVAATNNLLLDLAQVRRLGTRFDQEFGLSGGSDSLFTRQLSQRGGRMVWCDEAVVIDIVPAARLTRKWVLRRVFRIGNAWSRIYLAELGGRRRIRVRIIRLAQGAVRVAGGVARYAWGCVSAQLHHRARGLRTLARGAGIIAGSFGSVYSEYGRTARVSRKSGAARGRITADRARLYRSLRTAYLERALKLPRATIIYRSTRYDFHHEFTADLDVRQAGSIRAAWLLWRSRVTRLEINEPLMLSSVEGAALAILGLRTRSAFDRRPVSIVCYAMENADPFLRPVAPTILGRLRMARKKVLARFIWNQLDRLVFATEAAEETYDNAFPARSAHLVQTRIPALPAPCSCPDAGDSRSPHVVFVGGLIERKGFPLVLEAWPEVRKRIPDARLTILGKGALERDALDAAERDATIELLIDPERAEIHRQLRRSRVLVLPSQPTTAWREQVGLPIMEGLAHGCAIVTTTETGLAKWLNEHGHGVIPPGSPAVVLADALTEALLAGRSAEDVLADLPAVDGRLGADAWLFGDRVSQGGL
jgi:glycosyltransferase involved in cell wall biosynthesis